MIRAARTGVYVHIPFCAARCDYCDFATWTDRAHLIDVYVDACVRDLAQRALAPVDTVFFGGGTPSLLAAHQLTRILDAIPRAGDAEVTVECNPDSVDLEKFRAYVGAGVNRVSFGVQSMRPHVLVALGRTHDPDNVERAVRYARDAGFTSLNLDLIYGSPSESVDDWRHTLDATLRLAPEHVSAYALTVEPGTPLGKAVAAGTRVAPDDDDQAEKYELAEALLTDAGLANYEVSNWARPGHECRHNQLYWGQHDYVGIGCAAHSHRAGRRWWNLRTPERYIAAVREGRPTEAAGETLDGDVRRVEGLQLSLRTTAGVPLDALDGDDLPGLVERADDRWVLTRRGRLMANEVAVRLR